MSIASTLLEQTEVLQARLDNANAKHLAEFTPSVSAGGPLDPVGEMWAIYGNSDELRASSEYRRFAAWWDDFTP